MQQQTQKPWLQNLGFRLAFPDHADLPTEESELGLKPEVAGLVAAQFSPPESFILFGPGLTFMTAVSMPEAPVYE
jgi:hypothetical protein